MISEMVIAFGEATATLTRGGAAHEVVRGYRTHGQTNVRRLTVILKRYDVS
jgi:hypothetical protein